MLTQSHTHQTDTSPLSVDASAYLAQARAAADRMPPLWPLTHFVAVNPFVGLGDVHFANACEIMGRIAPGGILLPLAQYRERFERGEISEDDLQAALVRAWDTLPTSWSGLLRGITVDGLSNALHSKAGADCEQVMTVADAIDCAAGTRWIAFVTEEIAKHCAAYFDHGQSAWRSPWQSQSLYHAWRDNALIDASPELAGLKSFRRLVAALPNTPEEAIPQLLSMLGMAVDDAQEFLHRQLFTIRGWAGYVQYLAREAAMHGRRDNQMLDLLAIRLAYDAALLDVFDSPAIREFWTPTLTRTGELSTDSEALLLEQLWLLAAENAYQRKLIADLSVCASRPARQSQRADVQAVFCIDVRSERIRRNLEAQSSRVETIGFAGFFGMPIEYIPFGQRHGGARCPVLLAPKYRVHESVAGADLETCETALQKRQLGKRIEYSWNSFKSSAVSCFSFVEAAGLLFGPRLLRDAFSPGSQQPGVNRLAPELESSGPHAGITRQDQVQLALGALRGMGLTTNFARLVLICGHGSETANNPYGSGLDCGACGGHAGDANARVAAAILNHPEVRVALQPHGIHIPGDTWFVAGLHNTTTDDVVLYDEASVPATHCADLENLKRTLRLASVEIRKERAESLGIESRDHREIAKAIRRRSVDWSQTRPEWALAGNAAFIAAPRARTKELDLQGRAFLHEYDPGKDPDNAVLESILCGPVVVANWINLQYYASTVNNPMFGSGTKVTHNVVGTFGVCQGNGGDLLTGLPMQSLHDGRKFIHEPLRLSVLIECSCEQLDAVIQKHAAVRRLVDNQWVHLFAIEGGSVWRYELGRWREEPRRRGDTDEISNHRGAEAQR